MHIKELNEKLSIISRIVVHPKYRSIGLGAKLIRDTLPMVGTPYVEMVAVMAKYNPFAERAGMRNVVTKDPPEEARRLAEALKDFGFDLQLLGSERYVRGKLEALSTKQIAALKEAFMRNDHQRFRKEFAAIRHVPYGTTKAYREGVEAADLGKLAKLVKIVGILLQTKVYLFWGQNSR
jgi:GNAT superfamily N-acetyltransferase